MTDTPTPDLTAPERVKRLRASLYPRDPSEPYGALRMDADAMIAAISAKLEAAEAELAHHRDLDRIAQEEAREVEGCLRVELREAKAQRDAALEARDMMGRLWEKEKARAEAAAAERDAASANLAALQSDEWSDKPDNLTPSIKADFGSDGFHHRYAQAIELVSNRHSKGALVSLVAFLLAARQKGGEG